MISSHPLPLPISWEECRDRGWDGIDILLVTGDAYIDHPSFGVALIGRFLEDHGYRVAILSQPRYTTNQDFLSYPAPRLFCGITAGNLDSIVANYTGNGKVRETDAYSPGGSPWRPGPQDKNNRYRPDRATMIYANLARSTYKNTAVILGGIEASLRRFMHYDYKQAKLRASLLTDAKGDLLVYGMGERTVLEVARRCTQGKPLHSIQGSCERLTEKELLDRYPDFSTTGNKNYLVLPSYHDITRDKNLFLDAEHEVDAHQRANSQKIVFQKQQNHWLVQHPASSPLTQNELDHLYALPFTRKAYPAGSDIPAFRMIRNSVTIVRGCSGNCSFCAITRHQGAEVQSRSNPSIVQECKRISAANDFDGTITDLGGPTANLFATRCDIGGCKKRDCLFPEVCKHLHIDEKRFLQLLDSVASIPDIKHVFVSSGLRMELLLKTPDLLKKIATKHTPGALKIAPEHSCDDILELMHKEPHQLLQEFIRYCERQIGKKGKKLNLVPYVISSHPGSTGKHASQLARDMKNLGLTISKFQDFTPTPGTLSTAMFVAERSRVTGKKIFVAKNSSDRKKQRQIIEDHFHRRKKQSTGTVHKYRRKK
ncbi:YgiQ family radical SAM protein [Desulfopila sp. IMCC35008]|uniref:YgiQ family radical SAM protein n=1 Tax=Desulfopila sp. IMCC35008 TaxID=2653858 RepID=UPI0013D3BF69|nr:YgiQ family radical SAM protein [Desulfopila sp. IMCC35008]